MLAAAGSHAVFVGMPASIERSASAENLEQTRDDIVIGDYQLRHL
jgi:hypothetical protein